MERIFNVFAWFLVLTITLVECDPVEELKRQIAPGPCPRVLPNQYDKQRHVGVWWTTHSSVIPDVTCSVSIVESTNRGVNVYAISVNRDQKTSRDVIPMKSIRGQNGEYAFILDIGKMAVPIVSATVFQGSKYLLSWNCAEIRPLNSHLEFAMIFTNNPIEVTPNLKKFNEYLLVHGSRLLKFYKIPMQNCPL